MAFDPSTFTPSYNGPSKAVTGDKPVADVTAKKGFDPASFVPIAPTDATVQQNFWNKFKTGMMDAVDTYNYQVGSGVRGMLQLVSPNESEFGKNIKKREHEQRGLAQEARRNSPYAAFAGDVAGIGTDIASKLAMGGGVAAGAKAVLPQIGEAIAGGIAASPRLGAIAQQAALGGAYGATQYAEDGTDRLKNAAIGSAFGGAGEAVMQGAKAGAKALFNRPLDEATAILEKGKGTLGQVLNREPVQKAEQLLTKVPIIGTKGHLKEQRNALEALTTSFENKVKDVAVSTLATKAPAGMAESAQYHIQQTANRLADKTTALYSKFEQAAGKVTDKLPLPNTQEQAKRLLESQSGLFKLPGGEDIQKVAETLANAKAIHPSLLKDANKFLNTAYEKTVKVSETAARDILQVKNALNKDMGVFANSQGGEVAKLYSKANEFAANSQMPFKTNALVDKVIHGRLEPDKIMSQLIKPDQPEFLRQILKPMSAEGRGSLRNSILTTLHEKATAATGEFNAVTYTKDLQKVMTTMKGALNKDQYAELKGIHKLFDAAKANQRFVQQEGLFPEYVAASAVTGGVMSSPILTTGVVGSIAAVKKMLTSPAISRMLIKLAGETAPAAQTSLRNSITKALIKKTATRTATNSSTSPMDVAEPDYTLRNK